MDFKEMQLIWDSQNNERLYAINHEALYQQVKNKSRSTGRLLNFFEFVMIGVNLIVSLTLVADLYQDNGQGYEYILPTLYFAFSVYGLLRRLRRQKQEIHFEETMLGELDKAIWRVNYLLEQGRSIFYWYLIPLVLVFGITMLLNGKIAWGIGFALVLLPTTYFGMRWEARKWHLPKKHELESLRELLLADPK